MFDELYVDIGKAMVNMSNNKIVQNKGTIEKSFMDSRRKILVNHNLDVKVNEIQFKKEDVIPEMKPEHWRIYIQNFPAHAPYRTQFFHFHIDFHQKAPASEIHAPPKWVHAPLWEILDSPLQKILEKLRYDASFIPKSAKIRKVTLSMVKDLKQSKYGVSETITMWWLLGGAVMGAWLIPCDLSHDHIDHSHRSCDRSCGISHAHKEKGHC